MSIELEAILKRAEWSHFLSTRFIAFCLAISSCSPLLAQGAIAAQGSDAESVKTKESEEKKVEEKKLEEKKAPIKYSESTQMRALPGSLNSVPVFNSNSPEMVLEDGLLLSTFSGDGMEHPDAHLGFVFKGNFDIFAHHVTKFESDADERVLWLCFLAGNPSNKKVRIKILSGSTYLSQPDAPFISLPDVSLNDDGKIYAGPGDRVADEVLRNKPATFLPSSLELNPGETRVLLALPVPVRKLRPALNGRSLILKLNSSGEVQLASLARFVGPEQASVGPSESEWMQLLRKYNLANPRDKTPTAPFNGAPWVVYGRVAGVAVGNEWDAILTDDAVASVPPPDLKFEQMVGNPRGRRMLYDPAVKLAKKKAKAAKFLSIAPAGQSLSFPLSTVERGTFGTGQVQSAPLVVSYQDTAYLANGNYGVKYKMQLPLYNPGNDAVNVQVLFGSPVKSDEQKSELTFMEDAPPRAFFRGTVKVNIDGKDNFWHLVQRQGSKGAKLAEFEMPAGSHKKLSVEFVYPADATPPHVLSVETIGKVEEQE